MSDQTQYIYQKIVADMSEGLMVIGFDGIITHLNSSAEKILDKKKDELVGKKFAKCFFRFEENDSFNQAILDSIYDRTTAHHNVVDYFNGRDFKVLNITTSFLHNEEKIVGIVVVLSDISELVELRDAVKAMERIKKLNVKLELRNKLISATFGRFLSDEIVKELLDTPGGLQIGGKKRHITVMMSDLRGFTQISESLDPTQLIDMLNHYLTIMTECISEQKGTIIEFLGDGILVIFGAPIVNDNHAFNAVLAAVKMQASMPEINKWNAEHGYPELSMGIGINTGEMIVGNIGSEKHTRYGVIGKHVNLCGRIESYTVGGQILISPLTKSSINDSLEISKEVVVLPKGISTPIKLFDIVGIGGKYNLHCPNYEEKPIPLKDSLNIEFYLIDDKHVGDKALNGIITAISKTQAILKTDVRLNTFDNLEINSEPNVFCKVIQCLENEYMINFTTSSSSLLKKCYIFS